MRPIKIRHDRICLKPFSIEWVNYHCFSILLIISGIFFSCYFICILNILIFKVFYPRPHSRILGSVLARRASAVRRRLCPLYDPMPETEIQEYPALRATRRTERADTETAGRRGMEDRIRQSALFAGRKPKGHPLSGLRPADLGVEKRRNPVGPGLRPVV